MSNPPQPPNDDQEQINQRRRREFEQIERALKDQGPSDGETLKRLVGGTYWKAGRFDKAVSWAVHKKLLERDDDGRYHLASPGSG